MTIKITNDREAAEARAALADYYARTASRRPGGRNYVPVDPDTETAFALALAENRAAEARRNRIMGIA